MSYPRYSGDPYWLNARFPSRCKCGKRIAKSDRIFYYPRTRTAYCRECGVGEASRFASEAEDEANYSRGYGA